MLPVRSSMRYVSAGTKLRDRSCGECLKAAMEERKVTVRELSRRTGLSERCITYLRNGKREGNFNTWRRIAGALGTRVIEEVVDAR